MDDSLREQIETATGSGVEQIKELHGGMVGEVYRVKLAGGEALVAKVARGANARLDVEAYMLDYLKTHSRLPVPAVLYSAPTLLLLSFVEGASFFDEAAEQHAAELLADLHAVSWTSYGMERATLLGALDQPNPPTAGWIPFFRDQRLLYATDIAAQTGRLTPDMPERLHRLAEHLDRWLDEPEQPSLIHGDIWATNVLALRGRVTAFIDPAIYYGHAEMELAYITLFNTFGAAFFERYHALRPIEPGFFEIRRDLYNLYPLLTHARRFGGQYTQAIEGVLRRFGF